MKVAGYQAPLLAPGSLDALDGIRNQVRKCEELGVSILCCPEAILGGLADYCTPAMRSRVALDSNRLADVLATIGSDTVATIVGFTELGEGGCLYNSAVLFDRRKVTGVYRKLFPAIHQSVYAPGHAIPVFRVGELTLGIVICNDSNFQEPVSLMAAQGAAVLFVPTNNGMPAAKGRPKLAERAIRNDRAAAIGNSMWIVRADVAGRTGGLISYGATAIVDPDGVVVRSAREFSEDLLVVEIGVAPAGLRACLTKQHRADH